MSTYIQTSPLLNILTQVCSSKAAPEKTGVVLVEPSPVQSYAT